tara:strand:+ start:5942 stop:6601 length:660 start_codon:yes stop_codon:yes gene_type:complete
MRTLTARVATKYIKKSSDNLELHIYDFDGNLFRSPEPPEWWNKNKLGGWYSSEVSLGRPFISDVPPSNAWVDSVVREAKASIANPNVWAIMCTGRVAKGAMRYRIAELLRVKGLDFDEVYLNDMGTKTAPYKQKVTENIIKRLPQISGVQIWEDTKENVEAVSKVATRNGLNFQGHLINPKPYSTDHIELGDYLRFLYENGEISESKYDQLYVQYYGEY